MMQAIFSRLFGSLVAVFGASIIAFLFLRVLPGNPARLVVGPLASEEALQAQMERMGLHLSLPEQYWQYITDFLQGDWGFSYGAGQPVLVQFGNRLPASIELGFYAFIFAFLAAIVLGLVATYRRRPIVDAAVRALSVFGMGMPPFWLALILLVVFHEALGIFPGPGLQLSRSIEPPPVVTGFITFDALIAGDLEAFANAFHYLFLPAVALGMLPFGYLVRLLRANLLDVTNEPFILVVRSKGIGLWRTFSRHALPNAFIPTLTASGMIFAQLLGGSVLVEKVFNWPGIGSLVVDSILRKDFAVVQAFIIVSAVIYVLVNAVVDVLYGVIDPRIRN